MGLQDPGGEVLPWTRLARAGAHSDARAAGTCLCTQRFANPSSARGGGINYRQPALPLTARAGDTGAEVNTRRGQDGITHGDEPTASPAQGQITAQSATVLQQMAWDGQTDTQSCRQLQGEGQQEATLGSPPQHGGDVTPTAKTHSLGGG